MPIRKVFRKKRNNVRKTGKYQNLRKFIRRPRIQRTLPLAGMPSKKVVRMRYSDDVIINPEVPGQGIAHVLRLNSIHDPDYTTSFADHQPMGHDEWANFYQRYHVIGVKLRADFYSTSSVGTTANTTVGIGFRSTTNQITDGDQFFENGRCNWKRLATRDGSSATTTCVRKWSAKKWYGGLNKSMNETHGAIFGTGPSDPCFAHLFVFPVAETSGEAQTVRVRFFMDFLVLMTEPKTLGLS